MICNTCGDQAAAKIIVKIADDGGRSEYCDRCGRTSPTCNPDVYWNSAQRTNSNITDRLGNPIRLESRGHKARVMRAQGLTECGDRVHGSYAGVSNYLIPKKQGGRRDR